MAARRALAEFHGPDWQGPPRMDADDVVTACIRALELDEAICVRALEAPGEIEALHAANGP